MTDSFREKMAALSFEEKIKVLEKLRDRDREIAKVREKLKTERLKSDHK